MKIAVAQIDCIPGDTRRNIGRITSLIAQTKRQSAELVVFPELSDTGYVMEVIRQRTNDSHTSEVNQILAAAAREHAIWVVAGIAERHGDSIYNVAVVIDPDGIVRCRYRKIHLYYPSGEGIFNPGNELVTLQVQDFRLGLMICYDVRFPELARSLALQGADLLIVPTAWPFPRVEHWQILTKARAIENQCYLVGANRVGTDDQAVFCGNSRIVDPHGVVISAASEDREEIIYGDINREKIDFVRNRMPVFEHRRPEVYVEAIPDRSPGNRSTD